MAGHDGQYTVFTTDSATATAAGRRFHRSRRRRPGPIHRRNPRLAAPNYTDRPRANGLSVGGLGGPADGRRCAYICGCEVCSIHPTHLSPLRTINDSYHLENGHCGVSISRELDCNFLVQPPRTCNSPSAAPGHRSLSLWVLGYPAVCGVGTLVCCVYLVAMPRRVSQTLGYRPAEAPRARLILRCHHVALIGAGEPAINV